MAKSTLVKQYILDAQGQSIGVILPITEYEELLQRRLDHSDHHPERARSLYGALHHLGGKVAPTQELDESRRELWSAWNRNEV
jgi:hypothetical protein